MNLVILGGGESGVGAAILGKDKGYNVFLSDSGTIPERYRARLDAEGIEWEQGGHTLERILTADEAVKSPGIPPTAPVVKALVEKGVPVISEIEFAGRYTDARMVCITGSNGKTTTTLLTYHILKDAGVNVGLAVNVSRSLALQVAREQHDVDV
ncbi:MAG: UDP-N-acetylmuramoyl-L-alanine--D-glutamate ligase, partial [Duncaniella sp.]|nr:UDP-N-acetylmuramoyl-L-alanine--D-glutamate ligase [Duncaniella sp.]